MNGQKYCSSVWDGWACHSTTAANSVSIVKCPDHIEANNCHSILGTRLLRDQLLNLYFKRLILDKIYFECDSDGHWFRNNDWEWANYTRCFNGIIPVKERIINTSIVCHSIALVLLITGLIILFSYKLATT